MNMQNEFYRLKNENEKKIIVVEAGIKHQFKNCLSLVELINSVVRFSKKPAIATKENSVVQDKQTKNENVFQIGIQLFHSTKEIATLIKQIITTLKK